MDEQAKRILRQYTTDAVNILERSIELYKTGQPGFYRVVAVQLRILLCDTTFRHNQQEDIAIVPILFPSLQLHRLDEAAQPILTGPTFSLADWLDLPADPASGLSLRQMIRRVCDVDGGAHVDIKPQAGVPAQETARLWIISIGEYLVPLLNQALLA